MADAKQEQIMAAVLTAITGLTTTGANADRGRAFPNEVDKLPSLNIFMGPDEPLRELANNFIDWQLTVVIESNVFTDDGLVDPLLLTIRKEVHAAIYGDPTFGLDFVHDTDPGTVGEPDIDGEGAKVAGRQRIEFNVQFRTSRTDISA